MDNEFWRGPIDSNALPHSHDTDDSAPLDWKEFASFMHDALQSERHEFDRQTPRLRWQNGFPQDYSGLDQIAPYLKTEYLEFRFSENGMFAFNPENNFKERVYGEMNHMLSGLPNLHHITGEEYLRWVNERLGQFGLSVDKSHVLRDLAPRFYRRLDQTIGVTVWPYDPWNWNPVKAMASRIKDLQLENLEHRLLHNKFHDVSRYVLESCRQTESKMHCMTYLDGRRYARDLAMQSRLLMDLERHFHYLRQVYDGR